MKKRFLKVYVEITNVCNLDCSFCSKTNRANKFMSVSEFEKIAKEVSEFTSLIALHVKGEPLLHPNLKEILDICEQNNLKVNITTNGTLLAKNIDIIVKSKAVRQINISLHSVEQNDLEENKYLGSIFMATENIHSNTNIIVSYRLWNLKNLENNAQNYSMLIKLGDRYNIKDIVKLAKENEFIELDKNVFLNQDIEFKWPNINQDIISKVGKCYGLRNQIAILSNGDVVPCCLDANADILLGNVLTESLSKIINNDRAKSIINGFEKHELVEGLCQRCDFIKKFSNI